MPGNRDSHRVSGCRLHIIPPLLIHVLHGAPFKTGDLHAELHAMGKAAQYEVNIRVFGFYFRVPMAGIVAHKCFEGIFLTAGCAGPYAYGEAGPCCSSSRCPAGERSARRCVPAPCSFSSKRQPRFACTCFRFSRFCSLETLYTASEHNRRNRGCRIRCTRPSAHSVY